MPRLVAFVDADVNCVRIRLRHCLDHRTHTFSIGDISCSRNLGARYRFVRRIDGINVEIFVTALVLHEQNILAVTRPEVAADRPCRVRRHRTRGVKRLVDALYPDVHRVLIGLDERDVFAVRRDLSTGIFRIAEKDLAVDQGRLLCLCCRGRCRQNHKNSECDK